MGCARCHDHKYDPISQREFYQLFALFNNADEPVLNVPTDQQSKELPALVAEIEQSEKRLAEVDANTRRTPGRVGKQIRRAARRAMDRARRDGPQRRRSRTSRSWTTTRCWSAARFPITTPTQVAAAMPGHDVTAVLLEVLPHESLPHKGPGLAEIGNFVLSEFSLATPQRDRRAADTPAGIRRRLGRRLAPTRGPSADAIDG